MSYMFTDLNNLFTSVTNSVQNDHSQCIHRVCTSSSQVIFAHITFDSAVVT